jgi:hypothetical protein
VVEAPLEQLVSREIIGSGASHWALVVRIWASTSVSTSFLGFGTSSWDNSGVAFLTGLAGSSCTEACELGETETSVRTEEEAVLPPLPACELGEAVLMEASAMLVVPVL